MDQKRKKIKNNLISSMIYQAVLLGMSFLLPRLYLDQFGSQINGVLSTIKQIFAYLCLLEAGVGLATTQALYAPLSHGDRGRINSILAATHHQYTRTGVIYTLFVLAIGFVYAFLVPTGLSPLVVFSLVILNAVPGVVSYFVQAKYKILMEADGRKYVITASDTAVQLFANAGKLLVLFLTDSLLLIQGVYCLLAVLQLVYLYVYAKKHYPWLDLHVEADHAAIGQKNSVLLHQISGMVFNNTDVLLLSFLCDFKVVSVYTIYNLFFAQVQNLITTLVSGFSFALGQLMNRDREKFSILFRAYETAFICINFVIYTLMALFLLPLIEIYTGGITDAAYSNPLLLFLFVLCGLLAAAKLPVNHAVEWAGEFRATRHHAVWEMAINLSASVAGIYLFGICGALAGTALALLYRSTVLVIFVNRRILKRSVMETLGIWLSCGAVFGAIMLLFGVSRFSGYSFLPLVGAGLLHSLWIIPLYFGVNFLCHKKAFLTLIQILRKDKGV